MRSKTVLALALMAATGAAAADEPAPPVKLDLSWQVALDDRGRVTGLEGLDTSREKLPQIRGALEKQIRDWTFTPGMLDGKPAATETTLHLALAVSLDGADAVHLRIEDAHTGGRVAKYAFPHYPGSAVRDGSGGMVLTHAHYDANGKVTVVTLDENTPKLTRDLQKAALDAVKNWVFQPERVGGQGVGGEVYVPICFQVFRGGGSALHPPPMDCNWTPPGQHTPLAQGQALAMHPAATIVTDVVGRTL